MERIWAAMPADGVMKPETVYGWTTAEHLEEWWVDHIADLETNPEAEPLIFTQMVRADVHAALQDRVARLEAALKPFAEIPIPEQDGFHHYTRADLLEARAALAEAAP